MGISEETARQIVESVKEVCGYNINFISPNGTIIASTDPERVGTYHEAGHQAAKTGKALEVEDDQSYYGTQKGVNMPVLWHGELVAVIGISGEPDQVRKYAYLAQKICILTLREWELGKKSRGGQDEVDYFVRSLVHGAALSSDFIADFVEKKKLNKEGRYVTICVKTDDRYNPANSFMVEEDIRRTFRMTGSSLYTYEYPGEYILILEKEDLKHYRYLFHMMAEQFGILLRIGIGDAHSLMHQNRSYQEAEIAIKSLLRFDRKADGEQKRIAFYENLDLEVLLGSVPEETAKMFSRKVLGKLDKKAKVALKSYLDCGCRLREASLDLYVHENTMKYQLRKVAQETGLDPRLFQDAVVLSLAMRIEDSENCLP